MPIPVGLLRTLGAVVDLGGLQITKTGVEKVVNVGTSQSSGDSLMNVAHDMESWREAFSEPKQKFCHDSLRSQQMTLNIDARPIRHSKKNTDIVHARVAHRKLHDDDDAMKTEPVVHDAGLEAWWWYDDERQKLSTSREDHDVHGPRPLSSLTPGSI